ncbi:hypothetical protein C8255_06140 [filamentous cyanobacterium CCP3]|nr:hypothetical protein C8255_06140 [filamentous cyanobacterium CCP3]
MISCLSIASLQPYLAVIGVLSAFIFINVTNTWSVAASLPRSHSLSEPHFAQSDPNQLYQDAWEAYQNKDFEQAVVLWQQALAQYQANENLEGEKTTREALGAVYLKLRQYDQVITYLRPLLDAPVEIDNWQSQSAVWSNLALALRMTGNYVEALAVQQQVLTLRQANRDALGEAEAMINLGQIYQVLGNYSTAIAFYQQSLDLLKDGQNQQTEAIVLGSIGAAYADQGNYTQALVYYEDSQAIAEAINDLRSQAYALSNLGAAYFINQQNYATALQYWSQALDLAEQIPDSWLTAKNSSDLGLVYEQLQQFDESLNFHNRSQTLFQQLGSRPDAAMALNNQAHTLLEWGKALRGGGASPEATAKFQQAAAHLNEAIALLDSIRGGLNTDAERVSVFDTQAMTYNLLQQVLVEQGQSEVALEAAEQGRSRAFNTLLAEKQQLRSDDISLGQIQAIARAQNATLVEYSLVPENEFVHQGKQRGTTAELYIWVVQPEGTITFRHAPVNTQLHRLEDLVKTSRAAIGLRSRGFVVDEPEAPDTSENLKTLHRLLIDPIQDLLPADPNERVIFIPQGDLFLVPFAALVDGAGNYLIERHTLLTAPSVQVLGLTQQQDRLGVDRPLTPADLLIVGDPVMPEVWDTQAGQMKPLLPLGGARQEAIAIADFFNTSALTGAAATEQIVKQLIGSARLVHLATHGLLEYGNPQDSGVSDIPGAIALAPGHGEDGLLTAAEILDGLDSMLTWWCSAPAIRVLAALRATA